MAKTKKMAFGGMSSAIRSAASTVAKARPQMQFMSDKLRGGSAAGATKGLGAAMRGGASMAKPIANVARGAVSALTGGRAMKKGGLAAGHKAADGIAKKGKTKAMAVKMAKGGKAC